jgi:hypothetical protein
LEGFESHLKPFVWIAALAGILGGIISWSQGQSGPFFLLWAISCLNLAALGKFVFEFLKWVRDTGQINSPVRGTKVYIWAAIKFGCLILLGSLIWQSRTVPGMTLLLGMAPMVVVPIIGGYLWSRKR